MLVMCSVTLSGQASLKSTVLTKLSRLIRLRGRTELDDKIAGVKSLGRSHSLDISPPEFPQGFEQYDAVIWICPREIFPTFGLKIPGGGNPR